MDTVIITLVVTVVVTGSFLFGVIAGRAAEQYRNKKSEQDAQNTLWSAGEPEPWDRTKGTLTVTNVCSAVQMLLEQANEHLDYVPRGGKLVIHGAPGDEIMRAVLERTGGKLVIEINDIPQEAVTMAASDLLYRSTPF